MLVAPVVSPRSDPLPGVLWAAAAQRNQSKLTSLDDPQIASTTHKLASIQPHLLNELRPLERKLGLVLTLFKGKYLLSRPVSSDVLGLTVPFFASVDLGYLGPARGAG